jgi:hypothetical protein
MVGFRFKLSPYVGSVQLRMVSGPQALRTMRTQFMLGNTSHVPSSG